MRREMDMKRWSLRNSSFASVNKIAFKFHGVIIVYTCSHTNLHRQEWAIPPSNKAALWNQKRSIMSGEWGLIKRGSPAEPRYVCLALAFRGDTLRPLFRPFSCKCWTTSGELSCAGGGRNLRGGGTMLMMSLLPRGCIFQTSKLKPGLKREAVV